MARVQMERSGEMEVFVRVVREGGFSAAARTLDLTPSAVSKLIARLEARLGARLLNRTTRALTLTDEGRGYLQAAERALRALDDADQAVGAGTVRGRLVINASVPFGTHVLAPALPVFLARHPELTIDLSFTDDVVNLLAQKADLAFRVGTLPDSALVARKLGQSRRVICAAPDYLARKGTPRSPADLAQHNCLGFNFRRSRVGWPFREDGREVEVPVAGSLLVNNGETLRQMALAGIGLARLSHWHVVDAMARGDLVPVLEAYNPGDLETINAVYVGGGQVPRRVRAFIDHMVNVVAASPLFVGAIKPPAMSSFVG
ncbi:LysR family transcriptional regulator [Nitrospirillum amazonense]|uniref:LysR family transcriptional regulator n=1 Tax=Nitrospirillum amazonense TaxID=28077 RepID=A0A560EWI8_9PROT|nr:LysR family transcriptional regulator [Nitrospirillum amazonense]TWB13739.1 LysR family transcriptional regulator [Nitrospirillum amazonense]